MMSAVEIVPSDVTDVLGIGKKKKNPAKPAKFGNFIYLHYLTFTGINF